MRRLTALRILLHDRAATAGSILGVIAIIFLVGQQLSVLFGLLSYMSVLVDNSGADIWVVTQNTRNVNSGGSLPMTYVERIRGLEPVDWVEPVVLSGGRYRIPDGRYQGVQVVGVTRPDFLGGPWRFVEGSVATLLDRDAVTVDHTDLDALDNPQLNTITEINGRRVRIGGITRGISGFEGSVVFTNIDTAREIGGIAPNRCTTIMVKLKPGSEVVPTVRTIQNILPRTRVFSTEGLSQSTKAYYLTNTGIGFSFGFTTLIGTLVGIVIITLTMYTTVLNRQKDFAVLRALGGRKRDIAICILFQALMIAGVGIVVGFFLLAMFLYGTVDSDLPTYLPPWLPPVHAAFTLLLCLGASLLAMRRATKIEPATAFR
jgi:putative ABC transport system permease protein